MTRSYWHPVGAEKPYHTTAGKIPEVGQLVGWVSTRKAWRVVRVVDRHQANWDPATQQVWEKVGQPDPETWPERELSLIVEPPRNPAPDGTDRKGVRLFPWWGEQQWFALTDPYPACVDCGLLWPCPCDDRNKEAAAAMEEFGRLAAILPGCCWACGQPIVGRQRGVVFEGENLLMPGASPAAFHTSYSRKASRVGYRATCRGEAEKYEKRWVAASPDRKAQLSCPGILYRHFGYSECPTLDGCPGDAATHSEYVHCTTASYSGWSADGGAVQHVPMTSCGERGCRGPKSNPARGETAAGSDGSPRVRL